MRLACRGLSQWFERDATIITPTPFLAGVAHEQFAREQLKQGVETWERPAIYGLETWLVSCWQEARYSSADVPSLLSPAQERANRTVAETSNSWGCSCSIMPCHKARS